MTWNRVWTGCWIVAALLAVGSSGLGQTQTSPAAVSAPQPVSSSISQPIYPLSQVHAGLHGTAYTVFQGSKPEAFDVEILGILRNGIGPGKDMILARLTGTKPEFTGVVDGMSGSPVYIDGKLLGAIGFRVGQFTKQPIAGITPIQQMLEVFGPPSNLSVNNENASGTPPAIEKDADLSSMIDAASWSTASMAGPSRATDLLQPIETPLVFDGFSSASIDLFRRHFPAQGFIPVSGLGSSSPNEVDAAPIVPGSAISAIIVSGDLNMSATCTVTYIDPTRLLACGHPITQYGDISLPMAKAEVVATIASSLDPMKIINTTQTIGSFTEDRESGILGVFGKQARMIPVSLAIRGMPHPHIYHFSVAEHAKLTPGAMTASVYQVLQDTNGSNDPSTYRLRGEITLADHPPVRIDELIASEDQKPASLSIALAVAQRFDSIFSNPRQLPSIHEVSLTLDATPGCDSAELVNAHILEPRVHAGDRITVEATISPYREPQRIVRLSAQLPDTLTPGPVRLLVSDGTTLDHTLHLVPNPAAPPLGLDETIAQLNALHATDKLYVTLLEPVPQAMLQGQELPAVPLTMANVFEPNHSGKGFHLDGETATPLVSKSLDLALSGSRVLTFDVQP